MKKFLFVALILMGNLALFGQDFLEDSDNEIWTGLTLKMKFAKNWRLELEQQARFDEGYSAFKKTFTEVGLRREITDWFDLKAQYRYSINNENFNVSRLSLDASLEWDIDNCPLDIGYRARIQDETTRYTGEKITILRNQISFDYNLDKLVDPFAEYEVFYRFNDKMEFRTHRFTLGLEWKLGKHWDLQTYYRIDHETNVSQPSRQYILAFMFSYDLDL